MILIIREKSRHFRQAEISLPITLTMDAPILTLEVIHTNALTMLQQLRNSNQLSQQDYEAITGTSNLHSFSTLLLDATSLEHEERRSWWRKNKIQGLVESILFRFERFGRALDILAQSSPAVLGFNVLGLLWGSLRFIITVSVRA